MFKTYLWSRLSPTTCSCISAINSLASSTTASGGCWPVWVIEQIVILCDKRNLPYARSNSLCFIFIFGDWCLAQWRILSTSVVRTWGRILLGQFLVAELNIQYPVKSFAPYLGGRRGRVPSDSFRNFLQEVNLYNLFKHFYFFYFPKIGR